MRRDEHGPRNWEVLKARRQPQTVADRVKVLCGGTDAASYCKIIKDTSILSSKSMGYWVHWDRSKRFPSSRSFERSSPSIIAVPAGSRALVKSLTGACGALVSALFGRDLGTSLAGFGK